MLKLKIHHFRRSETRTLRTLVNIGRNERGFVVFKIQKTNIQTQTNLRIYKPVNDVGLIKWRLYFTSYLLKRGFTIRWRIVFDIVCHAGVTYKGTNVLCRGTKHRLLGWEEGNLRQNKPLNLFVSQVVEWSVVVTDGYMWDILFV